MKRILFLFLLCTSAFAQTIALEFGWDPNPPEDAVTHYTLFMSTNVSGPYAPVGSTTGAETELWVTNAVFGQAFYYLVAYNMWTNSAPSDTVFTPPAFVHSVNTLEILAKSFTKGSVEYVKALSEKRRIRLPAPPMPK